MSSTIDHTATAPAVTALAEVRTGLHHLTKVLQDDALGDLGRDELLSFITDFEAFKNSTAMIDHEIVAACDTRDLGRKLLARNT